MWKLKVWKAENWEKRMLHIRKMAMQWRGKLEKKACIH
jgi:hypothetical protein